MDINEAFQVVVHAARNYKGTADEHAKIADALSFIQVDLQEYVKNQQVQENPEETDTPDD